MMDVPSDLIELGRLGEPYGLKGWVNVFPSSAQPDVLLQTKQWWISRLVTVPKNAAKPATSISRSDNVSFELFRVLETRPHADRLVANFEGIAQRELAAQLKGGRVCVSRAQFPTAANGEVYWVDLVGCEVVNLQNQFLGSVKQVVEHGAHPILVVNGHNNAEHLIPFVAAYVLNVDTQTKRIQVDWQEDY